MREYIFCNVDFAYEDWYMKAFSRLIPETVLVEAEDLKQVSKVVDEFGFDIQDYPFVMVNSVQEVQ